MKRFVIIVLLLAFANIANAAEPTAAVTLGGTLYKVPVGYLGYPLKSDDEGFLVDALWPDMKPLTSAPDIRKVRPDQVVIILVHEAESTTSVKFRFNATRKRLTSLRLRGDAHGLHAYLASTRPIGDNDKERYASVPEDLLFDELFTDDESEPTVYIDCKGDRAVSAPNCKEVFNSDHLLFEVTFTKRLLNEWKSVQESVVDLIRRFRLDGKE